MATEGKKWYKNPLKDISIALRLMAISIFTIYLYSTYSLVHYGSFLNQRTVIFILTVVRDIIVLLVIVFGYLIEFLSYYLFRFRIPASFALLALLGFTNISDSLILLLTDPLAWISSTMSYLIYGILAFMFLAIIVMVIGFIDKGNIESGLWIFFLSELSIFISYAYGLGVLDVSSIKNFSDFISTPLFIHAIIAIVYLEFVTNLAYLSTYIIPAQKKIERDMKMISRFEGLTPTEISEKIKRESRLVVKEKMAPLASLFAISEYIGPVIEQKFSTSYLAKLKTYFNFLESKDPELRTKITGEEVIKKAGYITIRSFLFSTIKVIITILLATTILFAPESLSLGPLGARIVDIGLMEIYIIYTGTTILTLFVLSELIKER